MKTADYVAALATEKFPHLVPGWPRENFRRQAEAKWECQSCWHVWFETAWVTGKVSEDDFEDNYCPACDAEGDEVSIVEIVDDENPGDQLDEFSNTTCDCCGTGLAGARYAVTGLPPDPSTNPDYILYAVCEDCFFYIVNGEELEL